MRAEYVNSFIGAARSVIQDLCNTEAKLGKIYIRQAPLSVANVVIMVGVVGEVVGQVYFELSASTAKSLASLMLGGMQIDELDELGKSAISEMGNMIMGNAGVLLADYNIDFEITPPSLLTGEKIQISSKYPTLVIPLEIGEWGQLAINVSVKEREARKELA